jgi:branched-chain amino acid transport system substrate-binding protein
VLVAACAQPAQQPAAPAEQPAAEQPATEEPMAEEAATEEPAAEQPMAAEPIVIGYPASLTGQFEQLGQAGLDGLQLYKSWANEEGGIQVGDQQRPVEIIFADDKSEKETAIRLFEKFVKEDGADFMMASYSSGLTLSQAPVAEANQVITIGWGAASDDIWDQGFSYMVGGITPSSQYDYGILNMLENLDPKPQRLAVVYKDNPFTTAIAEGTIARAQEMGFDIVFQDKYPENATDLSPILLRAQESDPDVLFVESHFQDGALAAKQVAEMEFDVDLPAYGSASATTTWEEQLGEAAQYTVGASQWEPNMPIDEALFDDPRWFGPKMSPQEWADWFEGEYDYTPDFRAMQMFASALAFQAAIEDAGTTDTAAVLDSLKSLDMITTFGHFKIDPDTLKQVGHEMVAIQWQDGQKQVIAPPEFKTADVIYPVPPWSER